MVEIDCIIIGDKSPDVAIMIDGKYKPARLQIGYPPTDCYRRYLNGRILVGGIRVMRIDEVPGV